MTLAAALHLALPILFLAVLYFAAIIALARSRWRRNEPSMNAVIAAMHQQTIDNYRDATERWRKLAEKEQGSL